MHCNRDDCAMPGIWKPVFTLRPSTTYGLQHVKDMAWDGFLLCDRHKREASLDSLLRGNEEIWQVMINMFEREHNMDVDPHRTELGWKPYDPDEHATATEETSLIMPVRFR